MNFKQIDHLPMKPGYGLTFHGGLLDTQIKTLPTPLAIVRMNSDGSTDEEAYIAYAGIFAVLCVDIDDTPEAALPDAILLGIVDAGIGLLASGINLYIHCVVGVSRSSYYNIALHMRVLDLSYDDAYALVRSQKPDINPNSGFVAHLRRLEAVLRKPK